VEAPAQLAAPKQIKSALVLAVLTRADGATLTELLAFRGQKAFSMRWRAR
jgi:hypothetical protein